MARSNHPHCRRRRRRASMRKRHVPWFHWARTQGFVVVSRRICV